MDLGAPGAFQRCWRACGGYCTRQSCQDVQPRLAVPTVPGATTPHLSHVTGTPPLIDSGASSGDSDQDGCERNFELEVAAAAAVGHNTTAAAVAACHNNLVGCILAAVGSIVDTVGIAGVAVAVAVDSTTVVAAAVFAAAVFAAAGIVVVVVVVAAVAVAAVAVAVAGFLVWEGDMLKYTAVAEGETTAAIGLLVRSSAGSWAVNFAKRQTDAAVKCRRCCAKSCH